jgi:hypothetical protein
LPRQRRTAPPAAAAASRSDPGQGNAKNERVKLARRDTDSNGERCVPKTCSAAFSLFGWLVADGWCWFVLREEYCWLVLAGCWWLVCSERKVLLAGGG